MKKFRVLHYRPAIDHRPLDNAISGWTLFWNSIMHPKDIGLLWKLRSSHCEIWIPHSDILGDGPETYKFYAFFGTCYTSTMDGDNNGSVKRPANEILKHPERWYYFEYEVYDEAFDYMVKWMETQVVNNQGYDKRDIAKFFLPIRKQNPNDFQKICSGFCWVSLFRILRWVPFRTKKMDDLPSPLLLAYWQVKAGAKPIDLRTGKEIQNERILD